MNSNGSRWGGVELLLITAGVLTGALLWAGHAKAYDVPTGANPSPLFGAQPFSQKLLRFEEFGLQRLPAADCPTCTRIPSPTDCLSHAPEAGLDSFLAQPLSPLPMRFANSGEANPWESMVEQCIRPLDQTSIEGRPPGEWYAHQRWAEFYPEYYFQTVTRGARRNTGLRDGLQMHGYQLGEFGPGGLYHAPAGGAGGGIDVRLHPNMPIQSPDALWTFDGTFPPKLLTARYGFPLLFRHFNGLPIDPSANFTPLRPTNTTATIRRSPTAIPPRSSSRGSSTITAGP